MEHNSEYVRKEILECAEKNYNLAETLGDILGAFEIYLFSADEELKNAISKIIRTTVSQERKYYRGK